MFAFDCILPTPFHNYEQKSYMWKLNLRVSCISTLAILIQILEFHG